MAVPLIPLTGTCRTRSQVKKCIAPEDEKMAFSRSGACRTPAAALLTRYPLQGARALLFVRALPGVPEAKMVGTGKYHAETDASPNTRQAVRFRQSKTEARAQKIISPVIKRGILKPQV